MNSDTESAIKTMRAGVSLALLTLLYGFGLGLSFGVAEDSIKGHLHDEAQAVLAQKYGGEQAAADKVSSKSWTYFKRAHLHANGLGTTSLALIGLMALVPVPAGRRRTAALLLGAGALAYSMFWMFAGLRAPGLGSTGAAKESLAWLALPGSGACVLGLLLTTVSVLKTNYPSTDS